MIYKNENGAWTADKTPRSFNKIYAQSIVLYSNSLDPLFDKAKQKSEFEFILTLLNIQGTQDAGWDPFETTQDIFETFNKVKRKIRYRDEQIHLFLLLYGLILEASYPYEIIYNLFKVISGDRYSAFCFPDIKLGNRGKTRPMTASEKIQKIKEIAKKLNFENNISFFDDIFNKQLRNAIFHSDYCLYADEIRTQKPTGIYKVEYLMEKINKTLAYYETLINLVKMHKSSYKEAEIIDVHSQFSNDPKEKAVVMIRKNAGVIGLKDNWTKEQISQGKIPYRLCRILPYEQKMINKNPFISKFPPNKITRTNRILRIFPIFIRRHLLKFSGKYI